MGTAMKDLVGFFTRGTRLGSIPLWKLAVVAGLTIVIVFAAGIERRSSTLVEWLLDPDNLINFAVDWRGHAPNGIAVTVVDIDDASHDAWGQPLSTPRKKLFELVEAVERRGAAAIVVDIDVLANATVEEATLTLDQLAAYSHRQSRQGAGRIPLLLVRSLWASTGGTPATHTLVRLPEFDRERIAAVNARLAALVARGGDAGSPSLLWGSALFETDTGGVIRHWRLLEAVCDGDKTQHQAFPSVGLAMAALSREAKQSVEMLNRSLASYAARSCSDPAAGVRTPDMQEFDWLAVKSRVVRLPYLFWPARSDPFRFGTGRAHDGRVVPLLDVRSAATVLERETTVAGSYASRGFCESIAAVTPLPLTCEAVRGRVVLIGSSHRDSRDIHFTPLGPMPGAYVLANTIAGGRDTLLSPSQISTDSRFWGIALFAAFALLATRLRNIFAVAFGGLLALVFLSLVANWLSIPASRSYESINAAMIMLAIFLALAAIAPDVEKWITALAGRMSQRSAANAKPDGS